MKNRLRVGIPIIGSRGWMGGVSYVELLAKSQALLGEQSGLSLALIIKPDSLSSLDLHTAIVPLFDQVIFWVPHGVRPQTESAKVRICHDQAELFRAIDVYFPLPWDAWPAWPVASWLPDFQHRFLPQFFSPEEIVNRDRDIGKVAEQSPFVVLSSRTAEEHFRYFYPQSQSITRVLPFHALVDETAFERDAAQVASRYGLHEDYLLCCNQFWKHKDHETLFRALALCAAQGKRFLLACTGAMEDYRHPNHMRDLKALIQNLGLGTQVRLLGTVPREDQMQLIRRATAMVQPSLFEGWSTVVEDGRALGKLQVLSDLPVHREQAPEPCHFFRAGDAQALTEALLAVAPQLRAGPDIQAEKKVRQASIQRVKAYGLRFEQIMRECLRVKQGEILPKTIRDSEMLGTKVESQVDAEAKRRNQALLAFRAGDFEAAETLLRQALQFDRSALLCNDLGVVLVATGRHEEAKRHFGEALLLDMNHERASDNLFAVLHASLGQGNPA